MKDDNFIRSNEFKSFMFKIKQNELFLQIKLGDSDEVATGLVK